MEIESEITVDAPRAAVFDYIARGERLPEYVTEFAWVKQASGGEPARGTTYDYKMARGQAEGSFEWTEFEPPSRLAWHGPPAKSGPGSMEPAGRWELSDAGEGTRVKLVMAPKPGGLFKLTAPLMAKGMRKGNARALERLRQQLEDGRTPSAGQPPSGGGAPSPGQAPSAGEAPSPDQSPSAGPAPPES